MRLARTAAILALSALLPACSKEVKAPTASAITTTPSVAAGARVVLDGGASSDPQGLPLGFTWGFASLPPGSSAALNDAHVVAPSFVADVPGAYAVELVVTNGVRQSPVVRVTVTATVCGAARPVAMVQLLSPEAAGPAAQVAVAKVPVGSTVVASGAASSDADNAPGCAAGQALSFAWRLLSVPPGSTAALATPAVVSPSFTANVPGTYVLGLSVIDSTGLASAEATLSVTADPSFGAVLPVAGFAISTVNAGPAQAMSAPRGVAVGPAGAVYVAQSGSRSVTVHQAGTVAILAQGAYLANPLQGLALDAGPASPRLLVTQGDGRIVAVDAATGAQSVYADLATAPALFGIAVGVTSGAAARGILVADQANDQVLLVDPAATALVTASSGTVAFGAAIANPWGVALLDATATTPAAIFVASTGTAEIWRNAGAANTRLLQGGALGLDQARGLALTPCPTPKLLVALRSGSVIAVDDCAAGGCTVRTLVAGLGTLSGLAFDRSGAQPALLVTDDGARSALYRIDGPFCSL